MRAVIQRVSEASVTVNENAIGEIGKGVLVLLGVEQDDGQQDAKYPRRQNGGVADFS